MNLKKGAKMSVENRLLPPKDVELADRTVKSIVDYRQGISLIRLIPCEYLSS